MQILRHGASTTTKRFILENIMDELDVADMQIENFTNEARRLNSLAVAAIPAGEPGDCDKCGFERPRLVNGWCCFCRTKFENKRFVKCED